MNSIMILSCVLTLCSIMGPIRTPIMSLIMSPFKRMSPTNGASTRALRSTATATDTNSDSGGQACVTPRASSPGGAYWFTYSVDDVGHGPDVYGPTFRPTVQKVPRSMRTTTGR